jgi:hypothetical protein
LLKLEQNEELRVHQTRSGLLFTTISPGAPSFQEFFPGLEELLETYDFMRLPHRRSLDYWGKYNWKTMIDGFQECLHCQFSHPGLSKLYPTESYSVVNHENWSRHYSDPDRYDDGLFLYFFPNTCLNLYNGGMSSFRACPGNEVGTCRMEFDYYNDNSAEEFEEYYKFVREVADEDGELCTRAQANLEKGIYSEGCLNPVKETGVSREYPCIESCNDGLPTTHTLTDNSIDYQRKVLGMARAYYESDKNAVAV